MKRSSLFKVGTMPITRLRVDKRYKLEKGKIINVQVSGREIMTESEKIEAEIKKIFQEQVKPTLLRDKGYKNV